MKKLFIWCLVFIGFAAGFACKDSTGPDVDTPPTITAFTASPTSIHLGESSTLSWTVSNATSCAINQGVGAVSATTGTKSVSPTATTVYTLTATNADGSRTANCTVTVALNPPTIDYFTATPAAVKLDDPSTLTWSVQNATTVTIDNGVGTVAATGSTDVTPQIDTTYTLTATNVDGTVTSTAQVAILPAASLAVTFNPAPLVWTYDSVAGTTSGTFSIVLTESSGVNGNIYSAYCGLYLLPDPTTRIASLNWGGGDFAANGTLTLGPHTISGSGQATVFAIHFDGTDANGYVISMGYYGQISYAGTMGTVMLQPAVEGRTDPRIMRLIEDLRPGKR